MTAMKIERRRSRNAWRFDLSGWRALLTVLDPREYRRHVLGALIASFIAAAICVRLGRFPLWVGVLLVLVGLLPVGIAKWRADAYRFGAVAMLLGALLTVQGFHTIEHIAQWVQYHMLFWTVRQSVGLLSPANAEIVHFVWNWSVLIVVALLVRGAQSADARAAGCGGGTRSGAQLYICAAAAGAVGTARTGRDERDGTGAAGHFRP